MAKGYEVIPDVLNLRSGPGADFDDLGNLEQGQILIPAANMQAVNGFYPLVWVSAEFVQEVEVDIEESPPQAASAAPPQSPLSGPHLKQSELTERFGTPKDPAPYLKVMDFKEFKNDFNHVRDFEGNPWSGRIYGHELMEAPLRVAFRLLRDRGYAGEWRTYDGCLCIRKMTGGSSYSVHSWGLAIDVNASSNPYGGPVTLSAGFIKCFTDAGFESGSTWHTPDGMHFQLPWIARRA